MVIASPTSTARVVWIDRSRRDDEHAGIGTRSSVVARDRARPTSYGVCAVVIIVPTDTAGAFVPSMGTSSATGRIGVWSLATKGGALVARHKSEVILVGVPDAVTHS